jgi:hypothetical protein
MPTIPGENPRESEILAPLYVDDETIDRLTGGELVELTQAMGAARGYLNCRCARSPTEPPADPESMFESCGFDESATWMVATETRARCITERMAEVSGFEEHVRCEAKRARVFGLKEAGMCWRPGSEREPYPAIDCPVPAGGKELIDECINLELCQDGSWGGPPCDGVADCEDLSDEVDCFDYGGRDSLLCGPELVSAEKVCWVGASDCAYEQEPAMCDAAREDSFLCSDGGEVSSSVVCDRVADCPDGRDESLCLRSEE